MHTKKKMLVRHRVICVLFHTSRAHIHKIITFLRMRIESKKKNTITYTVSNNTQPVRLMCTMLYDLAQKLLIFFCTVKQENATKSARKCWYAINKEKRTLSMIRYTVNFVCIRADSPRWSFTLWPSLNFYWIALEHYEWDGSNLTCFECFV